MSKCPMCGDDLITANAGVLNNIPYMYCRTCKDEVTSLDPGGYDQDMSEDLEEDNELDHLTDEEIKAILGGVDRISDMDDGIFWDDYDNDKDQ